MTFVIPATVNAMTTDWDVDGIRRGPFTESQWSTRNIKTNGSLPLTSNAAGFVNTTTTGTQGCWWAFPSAYDVSVDTKVCIFLYQHNAPNRLELDTVANNGIMFRAGSGTASTTVGPTNYRSFQMGGRDTAIGKERAFPIHLVCDLNVNNEESEVGTYDNTDVTTYGFGSKTLNMGGTTTQVFCQRVFVFDTTKNATNIPRFTGVADWDDVLIAMGTDYSTKITHGWLAREGSVFSLACPIEFGDNSTSTQFNDNAVAVFWADDDEPGNPRVRVTSQAFRVYLNLRNNAADTADFSGSYNCGNSYPPWNFNQANLAVVTFANPTFKRTGQFDIGSSITGPATWDDCGIVWLNDNTIDIDGSSLRNPQGNHLMRLAA